MRQADAVNADAFQLYGYFRSSAAYRVRIALNLKRLEAEHVFVHLRKNEQRAENYLARNAAGLVPLLEHEGHAISQSLAIIEYLDEIAPLPALLPRNPVDRAYARAIALDVACDIHPLNNLRVLRYLQSDFQADQRSQDRWYRHWIAEGFSALEARLSRDHRTGAFCLGSQPTIADVCLVPQVYNAERLKCDLTPYPTLVRIAANARALPEFRGAAPEHQADAE
jgi:maleylacetoacetate isomerase